MSGHKGTTFQFWSAARTGQDSIGIDGSDQGNGDKGTAFQSGLQPGQDSIGRQCTSFLVCSQATTASPDDALGVWSAARPGQHRQAVHLCRAGSCASCSQLQHACEYRPHYFVSRAQQ